MPGPARIGVSLSALERASSRLIQAADIVNSGNKFPKLAGAERHDKLRRSLHGFAKDWDNGVDRCVHEARGWGDRLSAVYKAITTWDQEMGRSLRPDDSQRSGGTGGHAGGTDGRL